MDLIIQISLVLHIVTGTICLATGLVAMLASKRKGIHSIFGEIYHASYVGVFLTAIVMSVAHWEESAYLFYIAFFPYSFAFVGYLARKKKWKNWLFSHLVGIPASYIGIVTAIFVVNEEDIVFIKNLPIKFVWFMPTMIGTPLIFLTGARYRRLIEESKGKAA